MRTLLFTAAILCSTLAFSQVGINTSNPQGIFHVDGAKDNAATGVPTAAQQSNDVAITSQGRMGLGTTTPNNNLDLGPSAGGSITDVNGKKLAVYNTAIGNSFYGLGVSNNTLQFHAASQPDGEPKMVLTGNGNVGIGTTAPQVTLQVDSKPTITTVPDGVMAPKLTGDQLKAKDAVYTAAQTGTLVYITSPVTISSPKTINVTQSGYYYFDGGIWLRYNTSKGATKLTSFSQGNSVQSISATIPTTVGFIPADIVIQNSEVTLNANSSFTVNTKGNYRLSGTIVLKSRQGDVSNSIYIGNLKIEKSIDNGTSWTTIGGARAQWNLGDIATTINLPPVVSLLDSGNLIRLVIEPIIVGTFPAWNNPIITFANGIPFSRSLEIIKFEE